MVRQVKTITEIKKYILLLNIFTLSVVTKKVQLYFFLLLLLILLNEIVKNITKIFFGSLKNRKHIFPIR